MLKNRVSERLRAKKGKAMNAKILAGLALVLALLVGGFAYVSSQSTGTVVAKSTPTPVATAAVPIQSSAPAPTAVAPTATTAPTPTPTPTLTIVTVSGILTDAATGGPVAGLAVLFYDGPKYCATNGSGVAADSVTQTKSDGTYTIKLTPASYFIAVNGTRSNNDYVGIFYTRCPTVTKIDHDLTINMTVTHK